MVRQDAGQQDGSAAGLGVLLGADGVTGRRSGIGRVTLEVARTLRGPGRLADHAARDMARRIGGGVVYHESNLIARPFDGATVVMMHDLSWRADPALHPPERVAWIERRLPATLRQATRFVSVSEFTALAMVATLGIDRARIDVVSPGVSPMFRPMAACDAAPVLARHGLVD